MKTRRPQDEERAKPRLEPIPGALPDPEEGLEPAEAMNDEEIWSATQEDLKEAKKRREKEEKQEKAKKQKAEKARQAAEEKAKKNEKSKKSKKSKTSTTSAKKPSPSAKKNKPSKREDQPLGSGDSKKATSKKSPTVPRGKASVKGSQAKQKGSHMLYITSDHLTLILFFRRSEEGARRSSKGEVQAQGNFPLLIQRKRRQVPNPNRRSPRLPIRKTRTSRSRTRRRRLFLTL